VVAHVQTEQSVADLSVISPLYAELMLTFPTAYNEFETDDGAVRVKRAIKRTDFVAPRDGGGSNSLHVDQPETVIPPSSFVITSLVKSFRRAVLHLPTEPRFSQVWSTSAGRNKTGGCGRRSRRIKRQQSSGKTRREGGTVGSVNRRPRGLGRSVSSHSVVIFDCLLTTADSESRGRLLCGLPARTGQVGRASYVS
jgi:hypothetical protein